MKKMQNPVGGAKFNKSQSEYTFTMLGCIVRAGAGFLLLIPFIYDMWKGEATVVFGWWDYLSIFGLLIGGPVFLMGLLGMYAKHTNQEPSTSTQLDVMRIRQATETKLMYDLMKDIRKGGKE